MKIVELRFKNLNSLYGEWLIDFTESDYESHGIFALTGPTGAGKSTILDAICLALYGATPRLGRITANANDIMSRQTGECFAEVVFISQAGKFRCRWDQRRARKAAAGNLQNQEHHISDAHTGKLIENKVSRVAGVVEEKTGMDFDRFTRSVLLAQGSFDTFLKADAEQKSKLLEQITGTEIYTTISQRVHERLRQEKDISTHLSAEIAGIGLLDSDEEQRIQQELRQKEADYAEVSTQLNSLKVAIDWLMVLSSLREEVTLLEAQRINLTARQQAFSLNRQRLALAHQAAVLDSHYAELNALRAQHQQDQNELNAVQTQLPKIQAQAEQQEQNYKMASKQLIVAKQVLHDARPLLQQVRVLDHQLPEHYRRKLSQSILSVDQATQAVAQEKARLAHWLQGRLLREYEQDKEALWREKVLLTKIAQLEDERALLQDNEPCPLCGSGHHPYAEGRAPTVDAVDKKMAVIDNVIQQVQITTEKIQHVELMLILAKRKALYGAQDPNQQEQYLQKASDKLEQDANQAREKYAILQQKLATAQAQIQAYQQRVSQCKETLIKLETCFDTKLKHAGFEDETLFLEARLNVAQRESLANQAKALDNDTLMLKSRLRDTQARLETEKAKSLTEKNSEQLRQQQQSYANRYQQLHESVVQLRYQLSQNNEAKTQVQTKHLAIKAQQKECLKWEQLHALIGSSDGKKYRNFAQGLTFELMVQHANQQLEKMTDRYLLMHDAKQPLHLDVIDNYQAGETRSTKNLSGGESFIVSLSLALGLSSMASRKVRVDSLFLDEGFGTLDEEALDTALGTLANLQQEGKLIGVISHVPALKERIATQIRVSAGQGGRSRIYGPGCSLV